MSFCFFKLNLNWFAMAANNGNYNREKDDSTFPFHLSTKARYVGLTIICILIYIVVKYDPLHSNLTIRQYDIDDVCNPGVFRDVGQLPYSLWQPYPEQDLYLPVYWTHPITEVNYDIKYAIIIQHGNLRNANNYFCGAINSLQQIVSESGGKVSSKSYYIIAPQFLIDGDICWHPVTNQLLTVYNRDNITCNYYTWSNEGWKDGHEFVNQRYVPLSSPPGTGSLSVSKSFYSYDVFNLLIHELRSSGRFPNLEKVVMFGFSAGGQTVLRYSLWPAFSPGSGPVPSPSATKNNPVIRRKLKKSSGPAEVQFVVADMSSFLYFDPLRPSPGPVIRHPGKNTTLPKIHFGLPNASWITRYASDAQGNDWLKTWQSNSDCAKYNDWR